MTHGALEAVMQALQSSEATARDSIAIGPMNEVARAFPAPSPTQRAVRRGDLPKQIYPRGRDQSNEEVPRLFSEPPRDQMDSRAGISEHERKQVVRVAKATAEKFASTFEQPKPSVPAHLAQRIDKAIRSDPTVDDLPIGRSGQPRADAQALARDSLIKARYASTILRVARSCDREMAARLIAAIARDFPLESEVPKIADIHRRAIVSFVQLADTLRDANSPDKQAPWRAAADTTAVWLCAVEKQETA
jgi:hypothetical protein